MTSSVARTPWWSFFGKRPTLLVSVTLTTKSFELGLCVKNPTEWVASIERSRRQESAPPKQTLDAALAEGLRDRKRYVSTLETLRLPILWGGSREDIIEDLRAKMNQLDLSLRSAFFERIEIPTDLIEGCEDYEMPLWAKETIKVGQLANEHMESTEPRRFHRFASDVPGWDPEHPVLLLLTDAQRRRLLELKVLSAPPSE